MKFQNGYPLSLIFTAAWRRLPFVLLPGGPRVRGDPEGPVERITVGVASIDNSSLFYVAHDRGLFKEQGLDINVVEIRRA